MPHSKGNVAALVHREEDWKRRFESIFSFQG